MYVYSVAGLIVRSELELPELVPAPPAAAQADVEIRLGPVPESLPDAVQANVQAQVSTAAVLVRVPKVGRYLVEGGCRVQVQPAEGVAPRDLRLFLLGSAFGAVYFQRGLLPLHASVVVVGGRAIAFAGASGSGKSTLAAWMNAQGHPLLCDDVCVIQVGHEGGALAAAGFPRLKLWTDALDALAIEPATLERDYFRADKFHLAVEDRFHTDPVPLAAIYLLQFAGEGTAPQLEAVTAAEAVPLMRDNTYRFEYIGGLGLTRRHFLDCVELAKRVPVHRLLRPRNLAQLAASQALIERSLA